MSHKQSAMMMGPEKRMPMNNSSRCTDAASAEKSVTILPVS